MMRRLISTCVLALLPVATLAAPCAGFTDVDDANPFCANVGWIKDRAITLGCAPGLYCPNDGVSRLQMAAFLNRLGDVVSPPNVVLVAPTGGRFQSIQQALDYAGTFASAQTPVIVKVAPGTYAESLTLPSNVRIEGAGIGATQLQPSTCNAAFSNAVSMAPSSQVQGMTIAASACLTGILIDGGGFYASDFQGNAVRDVDIQMNVGGSAAGIRLSGVSVGRIERVRINLQAPEGDGIAMTSAQVVRLEEVEIRVLGINSVGINMYAAGIDASRLRVSSGGVVSSVGIDATAASNVRVHDSVFYDQGTSIRTALTSLALITNTGLSSVSGAPSTIVCLYSYNLSLKQPMTC